MTTSPAQSSITATLGEFPGRGLAEATRDLLVSLGYDSEKAPAYQSGDVQEFVDTYQAPNQGTRSEREFIEAANSIHIVFQVTDDEIRQRTREVQGRLLETSPFDDGRHESFIFVSIEMAAESYPRGKYAAFTREINKRWQMPTVVLFRTASGLLTLAFVARRTSRRDNSRDVLGSVSLIREIHPEYPHRAHIDLLCELSLPNRLDWMYRQGKGSNFDRLLAAWLDTLDTDKLNRRFYQELFAWFLRAVETAKFPTDESKTLSSEEHVIRLITRLLFVWFMKEKGLVHEDLFVEHQVCELLKDYDQNGGDSYYRAVLQNLFFGTLNTEIDSRDFSHGGHNSRREFSLYRYFDQIADSDGLRSRLARTPFINGGLFDCLDSIEAAGSGGYRIDCFSDVHYGKLSIPNHLFFSQDTNKPGLITLFNRYKFTVEENTPAEQEVALDPELLGKVFENLLAAYNPETRETARKQTGSYYTPRPVVDYMVEEALVASLAHKVSPTDNDTRFWQERLHYLLDYDDAFDDAEELFTRQEAEAVIRAIAALKVLDPAVGSGAFPMGVLHKLTLALRRLDPENTRWESIQKELAGMRATAAFDTSEQHERDEQLAEISDTFERYRDSDFGRKLYLIQNSIYGVDIQPVATQIAKLRFFISLAIDQAPNSRAHNYGIKPLPNLETRFVAANTLLALDKPLQRRLGDTDDVKRLEQELNENRERHFHADTREEKLRLRRQDARLRGELAQALQAAEFSAISANKVATWDPYDQNSVADWFDPEYMFGVSEGFDVVVGNPPYVESRNSLFSDSAKKAYGAQVHTDWGASIPRGSDLLIYFLARSARVLNREGFACLITQNAWLNTDYGKAFQDFSRGRFFFHRIIDTSAKFFSDAQGPNINAIITVFSTQSRENIEYAVADVDMTVTPVRNIGAQQEMKWGHLFIMPEFLEHILEQLSRCENKRLRDQIQFGQGINVRKEAINAPGADIPTLLDSALFVASVSDSAVLSSTIGTRASKVPALIMPRGIGRYYCAFNSCKAHSYSGVDLYLPQGLWGSDLHYCLWAFLNSSLAWLFREVTGRRNLGGGMLKAEATDMKSLPIGFSFDFPDRAKDLHAVLQGRAPLAIQKELFTIEHLSIDEMVGDFFGISEHLEALREALLERVNLREMRAKVRT